MSKLRTWREAHQISQSEMARRLGLGGARTYQRYESGERPAPAIVVQSIYILTNEEVGACDMHDVRLGWIRARDGVAGQSKEVA